MVPPLSETSLSPAQVHVSETFLFCPSLASSLYMLLLRFLARQYEAVVGLASGCVADSPPTAEERQICMQLAQTQDDRHPNAHACRLHISLCALHTPLSELLPWDLEREIVAYVKKVWHVSVACRLEAEHELLLLQYVAALPPDKGAAAASASRKGAASESRQELLASRRMLLETACSLDLSKVDLSPGSGGSLRVRMPCPQPVSGPQFDTMLDRSCVEEGVIGQLLGKLSTLSYAPPEDENMRGLPVVQALDRWLSNGFELHGGSDKKGFLFLYELMQGKLSFKLHTNDNGHALGCMLVRMLPASDTQGKSIFMSILRVMMHNKDLMHLLPKFEDERKVKLSVMFRGGETLNKLLEGITAVIKEQDKKGAVRWPPYDFSCFETDSTLRLPHEAAAYLQAGGSTISSLPSKLRCWLTLRRGVPETVRRVRPGPTESVEEGPLVPPEELEAFMLMPLQANELSAKVVSRSRAERGLPLLSAQLPFDLRKHPAVKSELAAAMLSRLHADMRYFSERENSGVAAVDPRRRP